MSLKKKKESLGFLFFLFKWHQIQADLLFREAESWHTAGFWLTEEKKICIYGWIYNE